MSTHMLTRILVVAVSLVLGYQLGSRSSFKQGPQSGTEKVQTTTDSRPNEDVTENSPEEAEDIADGDLAAVKAKMFEQCKLVLVVRTDLKLEPGKISTECSAATLACYKALAAKNPTLVRHWETTGQAKIALKAKSEEQLLELEAIAKSLNLCARSVQSQPSKNKGEAARTVLGIGPDLVNQVTGKLRLL